MQVPDDWSTYMAGNERSGFNKNENILNQATIRHLKLHWTARAKDRVFSQPVVANGMIYWGSGDGFEHATDLQGKQVWAVKLGASRQICNTRNNGVLNTATVVSVVIGGKQTRVLFVGGGRGRFYALDAATGATIWSAFLGSPPDHYLWSSPLVYKDSVYEGVSSIADCPLVQGKLVQMDIQTGMITHTFKTVPNGCIGASIWGSPTVDAAADAIYFATGNGGRCSKPEPYGVALVKLRASDLSFLDAWQVPANKQIGDSDFGSTPTLFDATIGGVTKQLVGLVNKNSYFYAFDRTAIGHGPVWKVRLACHNCNYPTETIAPSAWDGTRLYVASQGTTINGVSCPGSVRALDPAAGTAIWKQCLQEGEVYGAVTLIPGVVVVSEGPCFVAMATTSGHILFKYTTRGNEQFFGPASVSNGVLYIGSYTGVLYAFGL
jgi:polyvinyl alcohol dehydrogenase (cytochrome)